MRALCVFVDWKVRVFRSSFIVDRQSGILSVRIITLSRYMIRCSHYIHFFLKHDWPIKGKPEGRCLTRKIIPLWKIPLGSVRDLKNFRQLNLLGRLTDQNSILQELVGL